MSSSLFWSKPKEVILIPDASKCSLKCPRCPRTEEPNKNKYKVTELELPFIKKIFTKDLLTHHVKRILL